MTALLVLALLTAAPAPAKATAKATAKPDAGTAVPCWSWRTLTYVTPKARYVCLRAPEGEYVHDNGKVVIEFCNTTEGPVLRKAAEHHLTVCAQVREPGKAVTPGAPDCWQAATISENGKTFPCLLTYGPGIQIDGRPARQFCADSAASLAAEVGKYNLPRCAEPSRPSARVTPPGPVPPTPDPPSVGPNEPCWKWQISPGKVCLHSTASWRIVDGTARNLLCGPTTEAVRRAAERAQIAICADANT